MMIFLPRTEDDEDSNSDQSVAEIESGNDEARAEFQEQV